MTATIRTECFQEIDTPTDIYSSKILTAAVFISRFSHWTILKQQEAKIIICFINRPEKGLSKKKGCMRSSGHECIYFCSWRVIPCTNSQHFQSTISKNLMLLDKDSTQYFHFNFANSKRVLLQMLSHFEISWPKVSISISGKHNLICNKHTLPLGRVYVLQGTNPISSNGKKKKNFHESYRGLK